MRTHAQLEPNDVAKSHASREQRAVRFNGTCCLNLRSITLALDLIEGRTASALTMSRDELASFLWFVEMCVMSKALLFDGTLPIGDLDKALKQIRRVAARHAAIKELEIDPITFGSSADLLTNAEAAIDESSFLLRGLQVEEFDQPVKPEEHDTFRDALEKGEGLSESSRRELALELVDKRFRGSKCAAALIASRHNGLSLARSAYESFPSQGLSVTGALINRFRLNYLNQLASGQKGAYAPDPGFELLTKEHARLFWEYVLKELPEEMKRPEAGINVMLANSREEMPLPPIGLYALMLTRAKGPVAVLDMALSTFKYDTSLQELLWKTTEQGLQLSERREDIDAYPDAVNALFEERFKQLKREAQGIRKAACPTQNLRKYLIPATLAAIAGLIPGFGVGAGAIAIKVVTGIASGATAKLIGDKLIGDGCNSYISQYKSLIFDFESAPEVANAASAIGTKVEQVFGRALS